MFERPVMLRIIWIASIHIRSFMRRRMPTNILLDKVRRRRGLKWGTALMLLAPVYLYIASILTVVIDGGGPRWLYLLVVVAIWNAFKMLWIGPASLILLARVRHHERLQRRANHEMPERQRTLVAA